MCIIYQIWRGSNCYIRNCSRSRSLACSYLIKFMADFPHHCNVIWHYCNIKNACNVWIIFKPILGHVVCFFFPVRIKEDESAVVCPVIDVIAWNTFEYLGNSGEPQIGGFDWRLVFTWHTIPDHERKRRRSSIDVIRWVIDYWSTKLNVWLIQYLLYKSICNIVLKQMNEDLFCSIFSKKKVVFLKF